MEKCYFLDDYKKELSKLDVFEISRNYYKIIPDNLPYEVSKDWFDACRKIQLKKVKNLGIDLFKEDSFMEMAEPWDRKVYLYRNTNWDRNDINNEFCFFSHDEFLIMLVERVAEFTDIYGEDDMENLLDELRNKDSFGGYTIFYDMEIFYTKNRRIIYRGLC